MPNDGVKGKYLIEVKSTMNDSISIKRKWLDELEENAMLRGKIPALIVVFQNFMKTAVSAQEWVAVPLKDFEKITLGWKTR